jgi:hypothetical protein
MKKAVDTMAIGEIIKDMVKEFGYIVMEISIMAIGKTIKNVDQEFIFLRTGADFKEDLKTIVFMDLVF